MAFKLSPVSLAILIVISSTFFAPLTWSAQLTPAPEKLPRIDAEIEPPLRPTPHSEPADIGRCAGENTCVLTVARPTVNQAYFLLSCLMEKDATYLLTRAARLAQHMVQATSQPLCHSCRQVGIIKDLQERQMRMNQRFLTVALLLTTQDLAARLQHPGQEIIEQAQRLAKTDEQALESAALLSLDRLPPGPPANSPRSPKGNGERHC